MHSFERSTRIEAPLETVWTFHSRVSGLEAITPDWLGLRVESVRDPDGGPDPDVLDVGSTVELSIRPAGLGPRVGFTSRIVDRERSDDVARFRDEMVDGPFDYWRHTHTFVADEDATIVHDRVVYDLPGGRLGTTLGPVARLGFEPMFRDRHRRTRRHLEVATRTH